MSSEDQLTNIYDNYFPDHDEINLDMEEIRQKVFGEIKANIPTDENSEYVKKVNDAVFSQFDVKEIEQFENKLKKLNEEDLLSVIEKAETLNFRLLIDYKRILEKEE